MPTKLLQAAPIFLLACAAALDSAPHVRSCARVRAKEENPHNNCENYILAGMDNHESEFVRYLRFDGNFTMTSAYETAISVARHTALDESKGATCIWMDQHNNWTMPIFTGQCSRSINYVTNVVADVLHIFYVETVVPLETTTPQIPELTKETTALFALALVSICVTLFYRKRHGKTSYGTKLNTLEPLSGDQSFGQNAEC